jgi:DNA recombination protein RmuC
MIEYLKELDSALLVALGVAAFAVVGALITVILAVRSQRNSASDLAVRVSQIAEQHVMAQSQISEQMQGQERALTEMMDRRLSDVTRRVGDSLAKQNTQTSTTMHDLRERLGAIKAAQENITKLSQQVVSLQDVLSNKQARGAFGEVQLEDQVKSALPPSAYKFQAKMENGRVADCLLDLPNPPGTIAIDAKFPLESYYALRAAKDEDARNAARKTFGNDVLKHVKDIAERYIIPGQTADSALMFLPSEAVYAELHAELPAVIGEVAQGAGLYRQPDHADGDPEHHPRGAEGCPDARAGRADPGRGRQDGPGCQPAGRPRRQSAETFRPRREGFARNPHLGREGLETRRPH